MNRRKNIKAGGNWNVTRTTLYRVGRIDGKQTAGLFLSCGLLSHDPEIYEAARKCVTADGIEFAKVKRLTKGFDETSQQIIDIAHNLFSWTSKCKVTPFDISRLGYPYMELACTACYIAAGQMEVVMEPETGNLTLDDQEYQKTQRLHERMERLYANMEITGAEENGIER